MFLPKLLFELHITIWGFWDDTLNAEVHKSLQFISSVFEHTLIKLGFGRHWDCLMSWFHAWAMQTSFKALIWRGISRYCYNLALARWYNLHTMKQTPVLRNVYVRTSAITELRRTQFCLIEFY